MLRTALPINQLTPSDLVVKKRDRDLVRYLSEIAISGRI